MVDFSSPVVVAPLSAILGAFVNRGADVLLGIFKMRGEEAKDGAERDLVVEKFRLQQNTFALDGLKSLVNELQEQVQQLGKDLKEEKEARKVAEHKVRNLQQSLDGINRLLVRRGIDIAVDLTPENPQ